MAHARPYALLWLAFGADAYRREAAFSILTAQHFLLKRPDGGRVVVLTDRPAEFAPLVGPGGAVHAVDAAQLKAWHGPHDYFYLIKVEALALALREHGLPTLMVDGDTYFKRHPGPLMARMVPGVSVMDRPDGLIFAAPQYAAFAGLLRDAYPDLRVPLPGGREMVIDPARLEMWIAGITGLHPADAALVDDVRFAINQTYGRRQTFNVEQYGFSHVLQEKTRLIRSDATIEHYWGNWVDPYFGVGKREHFTRQFGPVLDAALDAAAGKPLAERAAMAGRLRLRPFRRPASYRVLAKLPKMAGRPIDRGVKQEAT